ncbi:MAG: alpha/beta fold hydrolase [Inquilinaceae bacterium]
MFEGFETRRMAVGEADLHVRIGGEGPPLLLLHGYPQTHVAWHRVAPALARRFTVILPDLRGYGQSRGPAPDAANRAYSKRAMAWDMVTLMADLGHTRFRLAGHDRGGRVGYRLCLDHPGMVERFAALDIVTTLDAWEEMDADRAISTYHWSFLAAPSPVPERLIGADSDFFITHLLDRWAGRKNALDPDAVAAYLAQFRDPAVVAATCADYRAGATTDRDDDRADRQAGRRIDCPVLVLWGRGYLGDKATSPIALWRRWAGDVRECALDCGHFIAEEEPEICADRLTAFFTEPKA